MLAAQANMISRPYRSLSVQDVSIPLTRVDIERFLMGREVYRRTEFLLLRNAGQQALVQVAKPNDGALFGRVTKLRVLALPDEVRAINDAHIDVANATAMSRAAQPYLEPQVTTYVFTGKFEHINFIYQPIPLEIRVIEIVPPEPPKLLAMAEHVLEYDEDLPPIDLVLDAIDLRDVIKEHALDQVLLPCRGAVKETTQLAAHANFLDTRPPAVSDSTLLGCERSRQFFHHFYGEEPRRIDICPRGRMASDMPTLTKCCLRERGVGQRDGLAEVPWGANLDEVRSALRQLAGVGPVVAVEEEFTS